MLMSYYMNVYHMYYMAIKLFSLSFIVIVIVIVICKWYWYKGIGLKISYILIKHVINATNGGTLTDTLLCH